MSFSFQWPRFSERFHAEAAQLLDAALNKGSKPPIIADEIKVVELEMGTQPPELEVRDIGELTTEQFRGIFRLTYAGDAHIVLRTKVQANPLNHRRHDIHNMAGSMGILAAHQPLVVPMLLRLSHFKLSAYVVLVVSKQKGITLVFKTDPLQNVDVNSTFDSIAVIQKYIQKEIEGQLRNMFREDLPGIIHRLSQRWLAAQTEKDVKVEANYRLASSTTPVTTETLAALSQQSTVHEPLPFRSDFSNFRSVASGVPASLALSSVARKSNRSQISISPEFEDLSFPDIENFDPTYGLRPEGIPVKSSYSSYAHLFVPNRGLGQLAENPDDIGDNSTIFDPVEWDDIQSESDHLKTPEVEYETIPAVGGGVITRPRIYHAQSLIQPFGDIQRPLSSMPTFRSPSSLSFIGATPFRTAPPSIAPHCHQSSFPIPRLQPVGLALPPRAFSFNHLTEHFPCHEHEHCINSSLHRPSSSADMSGSSKFSSLRTPTTASTPPDFEYGQLDRNECLPTTDADTLRTVSPMKRLPSPDSEGHIVLQPSQHNKVSYLSVLSRSYNTLSPYTRSVEHFTVRTGPPRESIGVSIEKQPAKARRRRIYKVGQPSNFSNTSDSCLEPPIRNTVSPAPPSDCELSDVEHYFPSPSHGIQHRSSHRNIE